MTLTICFLRFRYKWSVYCSPSEQWILYDALDERGERERALKAAIKARFDIEEPEVVYEKTGSEYIGKRVKRVFGKRVCREDYYYCYFILKLQSLT